MKQKLIEYMEQQFKTDMTDEELRTLCKAITEASYLTDDKAKEIIGAEFPFLIERRNVRERVDSVILNRLMTLPDVDVDLDQYESILNQIKPVMNAIAKDWLILGFTEEDLIDFMKMQTYRILARRQYDFTKNPKSFFAVSFNNLFRDLNSYKDSALKKCDADALWDALCIDTAEGQPFI